MKEKLLLKSLERNGGNIFSLKHVIREDQGLCSIFDKRQIYRKALNES